MCTCEGTRLRTVLRADFDRYRYTVAGDRPFSATTLAKVLLLYPGLWALLAYRLTHYAMRSVRPRPVGLALAVPAFLTQRLLIALWGIEIDATAHIGPGLLINHSGGIVIGPVRIGRYCNISQGVTLGRNTREADEFRPELPTLGDRVWIGPGAVVAGGIMIGDDASIGANSVVTADVPPAAIMIGVPAGLVSRRGSFAQVSYRAMGQDTARTAALARQP